MNELERIGTADEIAISTYRHDGTLRAFVPIWIVAVDGALYVRSYRGAGGAWYRHAAAGDAGAIHVGNHQHAVTFTRPGPETRGAIDAGYRAKYARYGETYLRPMLAGPAVAATLQLIPQPEESSV